MDKLITWAVQHHTFANVCYKPLFKDLGLKKTRGCAIHNDAVHEAWEAYLARRHDRHYNMDHVRALTVSVHDITDAVVKETKLEGRRRTCRTDSTHVKRAGVAEHNRAHADMLLECSTELLVEMPGQAYRRLRSAQQGRRKPTSQRRSRGRSKHGSFVIAPTLRKAQAKMTQDLAKVGYDASRTSVVVPAAPHRERDDRLTCVRDVTAVEAKPLGIFHDVSQMVSAHLQVLHAEGDLNVSLELEGVQGAEPGEELLPDAYETVGTFTVHSALWGDGFPASARPAANVGLWLNDPERHLLKKGISGAIPCALLKGKEDLLLHLFEAVLPQLTCATALQINFPAFGTCLFLRMPVRILSADNKMYCILNGNVGGGGHNRLHFLRPLPIWYASDVYLYKRTTIKEHMRLRLRDLSEIVQKITLARNDYSKYSKTELRAMIDEANASRGEGVKRLLVGGNREDMVGRLRPYIKTKTWADMQAEIESGAVKASTVRGVYNECRKKKGCNGFPVGAGNNGQAFNEIVAIVWGSLQSNNHQTSP